MIVPPTGGDVLPVSRDLDTDWTMHINPSHHRQALMASTIVGLALLAGASATVAQPRPSDGVPARIVEAFDALFSGPHPGARAVQAKGLVVHGSFMPAAGAASLSRAVHLSGGDVPVVVRFSSFAGNPAVPDGAPDANPRGMAVRFLLPDGGDTDIVAHSYNGFPAATPGEFLEFLRAVPVSAVLEGLAAARPAVRAFLAAPKPAPASYGTETFFGVSAFRFTNAQDQSRYGRYQLLPLSGGRHLTPDEASARAPDFLALEFAERLSRGPVGFRLLVQLAEEGDAVADGSVAWPAERPVIELGTVSLRTLAPDQVIARQRLRFAPTNLVGGIAPSADPMLVARTQAYDISAERRAGPE